MKWIKSIVNAAIIAFTIYGGAPSAEEITVATGKTFIDNVFNPAKNALHEKNIIVHIDYSIPAEALDKVGKKLAVLGGASLSKEDWLESAEKAGKKIADKDKLLFYKIMEAETVVIVNRSNSISKLTADQLKAIFTGRINNWKDAGGSDTPIIVVWPASSSGTIEIFLKKILDGEAITREKLDVQTISDVAEAVAANSEAIGLINNGAGADYKIVSAPKLLRPLMLVSNGTLPPSAQKLVDFLQGEGSRYFKR